MKRRLLNLLTALSLLMCVAVVALWVRSYTAFDWVKLSEGVDVGADPERYPPLAMAQIVFSWRGTFGYDRSFIFTGPERAGSYRFVRAPISEADEAQNAETHFLVSDLQRLWNKRATPAFVWGGFRYVRHDPGFPRGDHALAPYWVLFLATMLMPALRGIDAFRSRVAARELTTIACRSCGYDLRATPDRCPECGTGTIAP